MADNEAKIKLVADTSGLKSGTADAGKIIDNFSQESVDALKDVVAESAKLASQLKEIAHESGIEDFSHQMKDGLKSTIEPTSELSKELNKLAQEIERVIGENREAEKQDRESTDAIKRKREIVMKLLDALKDNIVMIAALTAVYVKFGAQLSTIIGVSARAAGGLAMLTKEAVKYAAAATAASGATYATATAILKKTAVLGASLTPWGLLFKVIALTAAEFKVAAYVMDQTGHSVTALGPKLLETNKLIAECGGDVTKLNKRLKELGMTADEAGIVIVTNWSRIKKSSAEALNEMFAPERSKKALTEVKGYFASWGDAVKKTVDGASTNVADQTTSMIAKIGQLSKALRDAAAHTIQSAMQGGMQDSKSAKEEAGSAAIVKETEKATKLRELYKEQHKESLDFETARNKELGKTAAQQKLALELGSIGIDQLKLALANHEKMKESLVEENKFQGENGEKWVETYDAIKQRIGEITTRMVDKNKIAMSIGENMDRARVSVEKETEALNIAKVGATALKDLLSDAQDELEDLVLEQFGTVKEYEAAVSKALQKFNTLNRQLHATRLREIEEKKDREKAGIEANKEAIERSIARQEALRDAMMSAEDQRTMRNLRLQGASDEKIHDAKLAMIDREEEHELMRAKTKEERTSINVKYEIKRIAERQDFEDKVIEATIRKEEALRSVNDTKQDARRKKELAAAEAQGKTAKQLYDIELKHLKEVEERELDQAKNAEQKEMIKLRFEEERIRRAADFEIAEAERVKREKERLAKDHEKHPEHATQPQQKPMTRQQVLAAIKKQKQDQKVAIADRTRDKAMDKVAKQLDAKLKNERMLAKRKETKEASDKKVAKVNPRGERAAEDIPTNQIVEAKRKRESEAASAKANIAGRELQERRAREKTTAMEAAKRNADTVAAARKKREEMAETKSKRAPGVKQAGDANSTKPDSLSSKEAVSSLKTIASAAAQTNRNEKELIRKIDEVGGLT